MVVAIMSPLTINTNIASLYAQRRLGQHTSALQTSFERLSSGLRINKASDDVAGLAVSSLLDIDRRVSNQGIRNINDGISYLNVAEGAIDELTGIIIRVQELAEQAANGTLGGSERDAIQQEVTSLQSEYNRIVDSTSFNGNQLLTGLTTKTVLQGGYGVNGQLTTQIGDAALGLDPNDLTRAGETTRISTSSSGAQGTGGSSNLPDITADGRYIAFYSNADNLVPGDTNGLIDVFRKDLETGEVVLVSTATDGTQGSISSYNPSISDDGRYVTFQSTSSNLVAGDGNVAADIFRKDLETGETILISTASNGTQGNAHSYNATISSDGRYVSFESNASNLVAGDTNGTRDIFRKDTLTGEIIRVSTSSSGTESTGSSSVSKISNDGRYISFQSTSADLVTGDTNGATDIFRKDLKTGETIRVSTSSDGSEGTNSSFTSAISGDGRYITFETTSSNLVSGDSNGQRDVFRKDLLTGETLMVNAASDGTYGNDLSLGGNISADGRFVAFRTYSTNLSGNDTNGDLDIYKKDFLTGEVTLVSTANDGTQGAASFSGITLSADGRKIAFSSTATYLVDGDTNGQSDIFVRDMSTAGLQELAGLVVSNQASARVTVGLAALYQEELSAYKAGLGASISRATTFVNTLQVQSENYAIASSQITDVDVAEESTRLVTNQILQQAAAAVLGQANLQPEIVLMLLKT